MRQAVDILTRMRDATDLAVIGSGAEDGSIIIVVRGGTRITGSGILRCRHAHRKNRLLVPLRSKTSEGADLNRKMKRRTEKASPTKRKTIQQKMNPMNEEGAFETPRKTGKS